MKVMDRIISDSMDLWKAAADTTFLEALGKGTVDESLFLNYIIQDSIYLRYYLKAFAMGMFRSRTLRDMQFFYSILGFVNESENATRLDYLRKAGMTDDDVESIPMTKACRSYTSFLISTAETGSLEEILMAVMPCMLGYGYVFKETLRRWPGVMETQYAPLVSDYTAPWYDECCDAWTSYCEKALAGKSEDEIGKLSAVFREASRQELIFWEMAGGDDHE